MQSFLLGTDLLGPNQPAAVRKMVLANIAKHDGLELIFLTLPVRPARLHLCEPVMCAPRPMLCSRGGCAPHPHLAPFCTQADVAKRSSDFRTTLRPVFVRVDGPEQDYGLPLAFPANEGSAHGWRSETDCPLSVCYNATTGTRFWGYVEGRITIIKVIQQSLDAM